jgi:WD40 repeat protein
MSRIFISHSSADNTHAIGLGEWLRENGWGDYFLDLDPNRGIAAGERWLGAFMAAVRRCEAVIFLLSPAWTASHYCRHEVTAAKVHGKPIFGVVVQPVDRSDPRVAEIKAEWQLCNIGAEPDAPGTVWFGGAPFRAAGLQMLARGLHRVGLGPSSFPWPPADDPGREPYRGLSALEKADAGIYFGRDADLVQALDQVRRMRERGVERLLVVLGASGAGKSSFLQAGLLPRLDKDSEHFAVLPTIRPLRASLTGRAGLLASVQLALRELLGVSQSQATIDRDIREQRWPSLVAGFAEPPPGVQRPRTVIVPVDQAEELLDPAGEAEAERFFQLMAADLPTTAPVLFVWTVRSDMWERFQGRPQIGLKMPAVYSLAPMPPTEFRAVIEEPARRHAHQAGKPLSIDPLLTQRLVSDATDLSGGDTLPLLALALQLLYRRMLDDRFIALTLAGYETELNGLLGVIDTAAWEALAPLGLTEPELEPQLRQAYAVLATVDPDTGTARRREVDWAEIGRLSSSVAALISRLIEARLLVKGVRSRAGGTSYEFVEVAHEALLRQWAPMRRFTEEFARSFRVIEIVHRDALQWDATRTDETLQHRGERLKEAETLREDPLLARRFAVVDLVYLQACRDSADAIAKEVADRAAEADWLRQQAIEEKQRQERLRREEAEARAMKEQALRLEAVRQREVADSRRRTTVRVAMVAVALFVAALSGAWLAIVGRNAADTARDTAAAFLTEGYRGADPTAASLTVRDVLVAGRATASARAMRFGLMNQVLTKETFAGHAGPVRHAAFSPDGKTAVTASFDHTARIWNDGMTFATLSGHTGPVFYAEFSPNGKVVATASQDGTVRLWSLDGKLLAELTAHTAAVWTAAFAPDGQTLVTASADGTARIWTVAGRPVATLSGHTGDVAGASFSKDGKTVLTASLDGTARLWSLEGRSLVIFKGHDGGIKQAAFSPDGQTVVTASLDKTAHLWTLAGKSIATLAGHGGAVNSAAFSPDGRKIITASDDETARLWSRDGEPIATLEGHTGIVQDAAFSPDGRTVLTCSFDDTARLWTVDGDPVATLVGHTGAVEQAAFSPDGQRVLTASADRTARLWRTDGTASSRLAGHLGQVVHAAIDRAGTVVATASEDGTAKLWRADGSPLASLQGHHGHVWQVDFSPDGRAVATASEDGTARLWNLAGGAIATRLGHDGPVRRVAFSPDGRVVITTSEDKTARLWGLDGKSIARLAGHTSGVRHAAFSPDGRMIVTSSNDASARLWTVDGEPITTLLGHTAQVPYASFSPDGRTVATLSYDKTVRLWSIDGSLIAVIQADGETFAFSPDSSKLVAVVPGHGARLWNLKGEQLVQIGDNSGINDATFSPDGQTILTASLDGTLGIWNAEGRPVAELKGHNSAISHAVFSRDGRMVVSTSSDRTARIWPMSEQAFVDRVRLLAKPCLSRDERRRAFPDESEADAKSAVETCDRRAFSSK